MSYNVGELFFTMKGDFDKIQKDFKKFEESLKDIGVISDKVADSIEKDWEMLGTRSSKSIDKMKTDIIQSYKRIEQHADSTTNDIARAHQAMGRKLERINDKYYKDTDKTLDKVDRRWKKTGAGIKTVIAGIGAYLAVDRLYDIGQEMLDTGVRVQSLEKAFKAVTGSEKEAAEYMNFVSETAHDLGLDLKALEESYKLLSGAAMGTALEGKGARDVFYAVSEAAGAMQLSATQSHAALYALQQMMSKGRVQTEELRRQLGEQLPGAFQMAAEAMGVTQAKLNKMLELGQVIAEDFLPKFAVVLHERFGKAAVENAEAARGAVFRLKNAFELMKRDIVKAGMLDFFKDMSEGMVEKMEELSESIIERKEDITDAFEDISESATRFLDSFSIDDTLEGMERWIEILTGIKGIVTDLIDIHKSLPEALQGGILIGLLGLFSKPLAVLAGMGYLIREIKDFAEGLSYIEKGYMSWDEFLGAEGSFEDDLHRIRDMLDLTDGVINSQKELKAAITKTAAEIRNLQKSAVIDSGGSSDMFGSLDKYIKSGAAISEYGEPDKLPSKTKELKRLKALHKKYEKELTDLVMKEQIEKSKAKYEMVKNFAKMESNAILAEKEKNMNQGLAVEKAMTETFWEEEKRIIDEKIDAYIKAVKEREKAEKEHNAWKKEAVIKAIQHEEEARQEKWQAIIEAMNAESDRLKVQYAKEVEEGEKSLQSKLKLQKDFYDEQRKEGQTDRKNAKEELTKKYEEGLVLVKKYQLDKKELDEWYAEELRKIRNKIFKDEEEANEELLFIKEKAQRKELFLMQYKAEQLRDFRQAEIDGLENKEKLEAEFRRMFREADAESLKAYNKWKADENKKAAEEQVDITEDTISEIDKLWEHMAENMHDNFADMFEDIFDGGIDSWGDFLDSMEDMFKKQMAQMAAYDVMSFIGMAPSTGIGMFSGGQNNVGLLGNLAGQQQDDGIGLGTILNAGRTLWGAFSGSTEMAAYNMLTSDWGTAIGGSLFGSAWGATPVAASAAALPAYSGASVAAGASQAGIAGSIAAAVPWVSVAAMAIPLIMSLFEDDPTPMLSFREAQAGQDQYHNLASEKFDFGIYVNDIDEGLETQRSVVKYFDSVFSAFEDKFCTDLNDVLDKRILNIDLFLAGVDEPLNALSEKVFNQIYGDLLVAIFPDEDIITKTRDLVVGTKKVYTYSGGRNPTDRGGPRVSRVNIYEQEEYSVPVGTEQLTPTFFKDIQAEGEDIWTTFLRFGTVVENTDDFIQKFNDRINDLGLSSVEAYGQIAFVTSAIDALSTQVDALMISPVSNQLEIMVTDFEDLNKQLKENNATVIELTQAENARNFTLGSTISGINVGTLATGLKATEGDVGQAITNITSEQLSNLLYTALAEETMKNIKPILKEAGQAFLDAGGDIQAAIGVLESYGVTVDSITQSVNESIEGFDAWQAAFNGMSDFAFVMDKLGVELQDLPDYLSAVAGASETQIKEWANSLNITSKEFEGYADTLLDGLTNKVITALSESWEALNENYDEAKNVLSDVIDNEQRLIDARKDAAASLDTFIAGLEGSDRAPVQSLAFFERRYATLLSEAENASPENVGDAVSTLTAFAGRYLDYAGAYGGDYQALFNQVTGELSSLSSTLTTDADTDLQRLDDIRGQLSWDSNAPLPTLANAFNNYTTVEENLKKGEWMEAEISNLRNIETNTSLLYKLIKEHYAKEGKTFTSKDEINGTTNTPTNTTNTPTGTTNTPTNTTNTPTNTTNTSTNTTNTSPNTYTNYIPGDKAHILDKWGISGLPDAEITAYIDDWFGATVNQQASWIDDINEKSSSRIYSYDLSADMVELRDTYGYAMGGDYPGGLAMVGEQGPELINFKSPGTVYSNTDTKDIISQISKLSENNSNITVVVKIGDREISDITTEVIKNDPEAQYQVKRVANG